MVVVVSLRISSAKVGEKETTPGAYREREREVSFELAGEAVSGSHNPLASPLLLRLTVVVAVSVVDVVLCTVQWTASRRTGRRRRTATFFFLVVFTCCTGHSGQYSVFSLSLSLTSVVVAEEHLFCCPSRTLQVSCSSPAREWCRRS